MLPAPTPRTICSVSCSLCHLCDHHHSALFPRNQPQPTVATCIIACDKQTCIPIQKKVQRPALGHVNTRCLHLAAHAPHWISLEQGHEVARVIAQGGSSPAEPPPSFYLVRRVVGAEGRVEEWVYAVDACQRVGEFQESMRVQAERCEGGVDWRMWPVGQDLPQGARSY